MSDETSGNADQWRVTAACFNCGAVRSGVPGLFIERNGISVFSRQPSSTAEIEGAWRATLICPAAAVHAPKGLKPPPGLFPQPLSAGVWRLGYNARSSYGAHSYFAVAGGLRLMIDAPRWAGALERWIDEGGGLHHILLTHRDDVADAERYAQRFGARVWIHEADAAGARFATDLITGDTARELLPGVRVIPVPGHTQGSVMFLIGRSLFSGDSLAWDHADQSLQAWRDVCWYDWPTQLRSLERLTAEDFTGVFAGHGGSAVTTVPSMQRALRAFLDRAASE